MSDLYQRVVNMAGTALLIVDSNLEISFANQAALSLLKKMRRDIASYYPDFDPERIIGISLTSISKLPRDLLETRFRDPQRKKFADFLDLGREKVHVTLHPLTGNDGDAGTVIEVWQATEYLQGQEHMKKITEVSNIINDLTFQANILSLNASVEAAHAGEQGRIFAVIADEMRNLSQRCRTAAQELLKK